MVTFREFLLNELQDQGEINELENHLDRLFADMGVDVEFSRHFIERLLGREKSVTIDEVDHAFGKLKQMHSDKLLKAKDSPQYKAVIKDFQNSLNIVFDLKNDTLTNVTIMRKPPNKFATSDFPGVKQLKVW